MLSLVVSRIEAKIKDSRVILFFQRKIKKCFRENQPITMLHWPAIPCSEGSLMQLTVLTISAQTGAIQLTVQTFLYNNSFLPLSSFYTSIVRCKICKHDAILASACTNAQALDFSQRILQTRRAPNFYSVLTQASIEMV